MTRRQRTKRRAQRWARKRGPYLLWMWPPTKPSIAQMINSGEFPISAWQLPEHESHWLKVASLDPAKFEDGRFPANVNELFPHTVEPLLARADLPRHE